MGEEEEEKGRREQRKGKIIIETVRYLVKRFDKIITNIKD